MHELGIAQSALRAAITEMETRGSRRILCLQLRIGELAAVDPEAMRFAFEAVTAGTPAAGARFEIERVAPVAWCGKCHEEFMTASRGFHKCPRCGNYAGELRAGREIELARLELD